MPRVKKNWLMIRSWSMLQLYEYIMAKRVGLCSCSGQWFARNIISWHLTLIYLPLQCLELL